MVTAELATALPALVVVTAMAMAGIQLAQVQVRCVDAAREAARAVAMGDRGGAAHIAQAVAGRPVQVEQSRDGMQTRVTVSWQVRALGWLPSIRVRDTAVAVTEPDTAAAVTERDRGSATVWVVAAIALIAGVLLCSLLRIAAIAERHRVERSADLTAIAAAAQIGRTSGDPCRVARFAAAANGAALAGCAARIDPGGRSGTVTVGVSRVIRLPVVGPRTATARAVAARLPSEP